MGSHIQLLDPHTINQIAAGEVVERPASVVKELVENALDAGATRVTVELLESGGKMIRVSDDGIGMSLEDALASLQRHATSKIRAVEDLSSVTTLGFRGEAIPSIASVSVFTLSTGEQDGARHLIRVEGGQRQLESHEAGPRGTTVTVEDLFFNTPARLKFLKTNATELGQITEILGKYAISMPHVAFKLIHGGHVLLDSPGDGEPLHAVAAVWGRDITRALAEVSVFREGVRVRGFISPPHVTKPTRSQQWIFVNGRPVRNRGLYAAIDAAYRQITPEKRYPIAMLMLDLDPGKVDMNVSPTKSECRFSQERNVFEAVRTGVKDALMAHGMMPSFDQVLRANEALRGPDQPLLGETWGQSGPGWVTERGLPPGLQYGAHTRSGIDGGHSVVSGWDQAAVFGALPTSPAAVEGSGTPEIGIGAPHGAAIEPDSLEGVVGDGVNGVRTTFGDDVGRASLPLTGLGSDFTGRFLNGLRVIGQTADAFFIIAENAEGLMVIDQHVAHERVLFEMLRQARGRNAVEKQALLTPVTLDLERRQSQLLTERLDEFVAMGFELEAFGPQSFLVRSVPAALRGQDPTLILRDLVDEIVDGAGAPGMSAREQVWVMCSCKMAIKAGDRLGLPEMEKLLLDLAYTENPYLCPHGRPITITLGKNELLRRFKRA